jgi:hypothetical protein
MCTYVITKTDFVQKVDGLQKMDENVELKNEAKKGLNSVLLCPIHSLSPSDLLKAL